MDFGGANRTAPVSGTPAVLRADVIATRNSVPVELAPDKTVQSLKAGDAVRVDIQQKDQRAQQRATSEQQTRLQAAKDRIVIEPETQDGRARKAGSGHGRDHLATAGRDAAETAHFLEAAGGARAGTQERSAAGFRADRLNALPPA